MINQQYLFVCDICYQEKLENVGIINFGDTSYYPNLPKGWIYLNNLLICNKHKAETRIDGELIMKCQDCGEILPLKVLHSNAGYYVGRWCSNCGPYSRESGYFKDSKSAELELDIIKHPYDKNENERWS